MSDQFLPIDAPKYRVEAEICGRTEIGPIRTENQDAVMVATAVGMASGTRLSWSGVVPDRGISAAVIDGMGGYAGGSDAAAMVATELAKTALDHNSERWDEWFSSLSLKIAAAGEALGTPDMGATAALIGFTPTGLVVVNVGDCRVYRAVSGHLGQLSVDDRTDDPESSSVTQALGGRRRLDAHAWQQTYAGGKERFVLCSDGVWSTLDANMLRDYCTADATPGHIVDAIAEAVYEQESRDNASIIVIDLTATATFSGENPDAGKVHTSSVSVEAGTIEETTGP
ncbi:PP2C family protein-serine/threonine phosphatase [Microbacterium sp. CH-015]|uniref:PP2C family protein-serine/threonine phosphatase n=1 Tax=Microbacterium sp. CH-015 TaxID=3406734 RepID=UPI003C733585